MPGSRHSLLQVQPEPRPAGARQLIPALLRGEGWRERSPWGRAAQPALAQPAWLSQALPRTAQRCLLRGPIFGELAGASGSARASPPRLPAAKPPAR